MERVEEDRLHRCSAGPVVMDVIIGESQTGGITVHRDGREIASGVDVLEDVELGECTDLVESTVTVRAMVSVVSEPPRTSLICTCRNGGHEQREVFAGPQLEIGDGVLFKIRCTFEVV